MGVDPVTHQAPAAAPGDVVGSTSASAPGNIVASTAARGYIVASAAGPAPVGIVASAAAPGLPEELLSAVASLGGLNSVLMQALQRLLQTINGGCAAAGLMASNFGSAADNNAMLKLNASSMVPSFQDQMSLLQAHARDRPVDDCYLNNIVSSFPEHDAVQQLDSAAAPAALMPASFPEEVAAAAERQEHGFAGLLSEANDMTSIGSLEDDRFWKDVLADGSSLPL
jgi:myb proto-oncogene protein